MAWVDAWVGMGQVEIFQFFCGYGRIGLTMAKMLCLRGLHKISGSECTL